MHVTIPSMALSAIMALPLFNIASVAGQPARLESRDGPQILTGTVAELAARELALRQVPEIVRRDIEAGLGEIDYEHLLERDEITGHALFKRQDNVNFVGGGRARDPYPNWQNGHGPGIGNCANGMVGHTYDDGPWLWHRAITDLYRNANQQLTFFINGNNYDCIYNPDRVRDIQHSMDRGASMQSHTWGHANLTNFLTARQIDAQIQLLEEAMWKILGVVPRYLRPPYGETNDTVVRYLTERWGLVVTQWNIDTGDAAGFTGPQSAQVIKNIPKGQAALTLNHETHEGTLKYVVPAQLEKAKNEGIQLVTVHKCLARGGSPYKARGQRQNRDASWTCNGKLAPGDPGPR